MKSLCGKYKMWSFSRDAFSIPGLPSPLVAVSTFCSWLDQVCLSLCFLSSMVPKTLALLRSLHGPGRPQEHTATPQYPPIKVGTPESWLSSSFHSQEKKKFEEATEFMKNLKTVEEKQYQINRPKYYGWYSHTLSQVEIHYPLKVRCT